MTSLTEPPDLEIWIVPQHSWDSNVLKGVKWHGDSSSRWVVFYLWLRMRENIDKKPTLVASEGNWVHIRGHAINFGTFICDIKETMCSLNVQRIWKAAWRECTRVEQFKVWNFPGICSKQNWMLDSLSLVRCLTEIPSCTVNANNTKM